METGAVYPAFLFSAAGFDDVNEISFNGNVKSVREHALDVVNDIEEFFKDFDFVSDIISYQKEKIVSTEKRYANIIAERFDEDYVKKGIRLSEKYADELFNEE